MYEYRTNNNPAAMPLGDDTISTHETARGAYGAWDDEHRRFSASPHSTGGAYLQRLVIHVDGGDEAHAVGRCRRCQADSEDTPESDID